MKHSRQAAGLRGKYWTLTEYWGFWPGITSIVWILTLMVSSGCPTRTFGDGVASACVEDLEICMHDCLSGRFVIILDASRWSTINCIEGSRTHMRMTTCKRNIRIKATHQADASCSAGKEGLERPRLLNLCL